MPQGAIFHLQYDKIGKDTHRVGTAAARLGYIVRSRACSQVLSCRLPEHVAAATAPGRAAVLRRWMAEQETNSRSNARLLDVAIIALPRLLTKEQRQAAIHAFAEEITKGQAIWVAGVHDFGKDKDNPHVHIAFRDVRVRNPKTGRLMQVMSSSASRFPRPCEGGIQCS